ncbi:MAG TPA: P-II family nitrogen regulator [Gemmatimonadales bacterium]
MVIAFVQPFMAPQVVSALHQVPGLTGATLSDAHGFGRGRPTDDPTSEVLYGTAAKVRIEVMVHDDLEDVVVRAIREAAHTGNRGDGKAYVLPVNRAVRIATNEEGEDAICPFHPEEAHAGAGDARARGVRAEA